MEVKEYKVHSSSQIILQAVLDDIVNSKLDAIVCPGNSLGLMRGGASQAIRLNSSDKVEAMAKRKAPINIGRAIHIKACGQLAKQGVKGIIYTPAIVNPVDLATSKTVFSATKAAIKCAIKNNYHSIAFPIIGAGTGRVNFEDACNAILDGILNEKWNSNQQYILGIYIRRVERYEMLNEIIQKKAVSDQTFGKSPIKV